MLWIVTHYTGHILANTRSDQPHQGDQEMETVISCTKSSQVVGLSVHMMVCRTLAPNYCTCNYRCTDYAGIKKSI